ncbi:MAG: NAD(P)/FAD-dependent oxidoreductase [Maribacter sp.]|uniref:NAD(P)/FAD-dependent oxidoreductase n=1 Tax=Maribacter sp. TaxID=1897614 RepID=UPI003C7414C1
MFDVIIVGGGAAGFYAAIHMAEINPNLDIAILERGKDVLKKVRISGGGRCNVTNGESDPKELTANYPRGSKELLGPLYSHGTQDTMQFFIDRGVPLKIEDDGRVFPESNSSQTIVDYFLNETARLGIRVFRQSSVIAIEAETREDSSQRWRITTVKKEYFCKKVLVAAGSNPKVWQLLEKLDHTIVPPVPSLFTFNITDERIAGIQGISTPARVEVLPKNTFKPEITLKLKSKENEKTLFSAEGPLLITHWGLSGPAILRLSAWGALTLNEYKYHFPIRVNWLPEYHQGSVLPLLMEVKEVEAKKTVLRTKAVEIPRRLWTNLVKASGIEKDEKWAEVTKEQLQHLADQLTNGRFLVEGKSTFKDEFVTAGGIDLKEINFKTYESKIHKNLYFAGEIINVDAITGGFNFQNAWTSGYIAAHAIAEAFKK